MSETRLVRAVKLNNTITVSIPKKVAERLGIEKGTYLLFDYDEKEGVIKYRKIKNIEELVDA